MKRKLASICLFICVCSLAKARAGDIWQRVFANKLPGETEPAHPSAYLLYSANEQLLKAELNAQARGNAGAIVELPLPDGSFRYFKVVRSAVLPDALANKYPGLSTYNAVAVDNPAITAKLDFTVFGFHAMIMNGGAMSFIDPANNEHDGYYAVHYKKDEVRPQEKLMPCLIPADKGKDLSARHENAAAMKVTAAIKEVSNGYTLRTYRLALSCDHQYAQTVTGNTSPTKAEVLSKMLTTMNRVNGIYEKEIAVTLVFADKEDTLIYPVEDNDPFGDYDSAPNAGYILTLNQKICDSLIGTLNYDIGHIFTTGAGGYSQLGVVCDPTLKAQSVTGSAVPYGDGYDVDYVAHEMGHELGSQHTFNDNSSVNCSPNAVAECAYEPGSGSTIMCYAGICTGDNIQPHSDAYFCASSLIQIRDYITSGGDGCAVKTPTNNKLAAVPSFNAQYTIPYLTPFELTAPTATDSLGDSVTYCWEQWNLGDFGMTFENTHNHGPIFRSYTPVSSRTRVFPTMKMVLSSVLSNVGKDDSCGEKVPDVARVLDFRLTVRNVHGTYGSFIIPGDSIHIDAVNTGTGFKVTSQDDKGAKYLGKTQQTVTWDVVHTNEAPINATNVDIYLSIDSAKTWAFYLGTYPNTGSATVTLPNPTSDVSAGRIKVKGQGNVFFNVNGADMRIERNFEADVRMYPMPARNTLTIETENSGILDGAIYNVVGQRIWQGAINGREDIPVALWGRGIYFVKLTDADNRPLMRRILVD